MKYFGIILFLFSITVYAQEGQKQNEFNLSLGWGHPFGFSVGYGRLVTANHLIGTGIGISSSGFRLGLEYRYQLTPENKLAPYVGTACSFANGSNKVEVSVNQDTALYKLKGGIQIASRMGLRYRLSFADVFFNAGYGFVIVGGGKEFVSGSTENSVETFADLLSMGGLELSMTIAIYN